MRLHEVHRIGHDKSMAGDWHPGELIGVPCRPMARSRAEPDAIYMAEIAFKWSRHFERRGCARWFSERLLLFRHSYSSQNVFSRCTPFRGDSRQEEVGNAPMRPDLKQTF